VANARAVAQALEGHPMVERVRYAGLPSNPYHASAQKYLPRGAGSVFAFDLRGDRVVGQRFIEALTLWSHLANVGDTKSLVIHPASTTHRQLSDTELAATGVAPGTIRLSVGLEAVDDLLWDLERALRVAARVSSPPDPLSLRGEGEPSPTVASLAPLPLGRGRGGGDEDRQTADGDTATQPSEVVR
jgi:O-acetylhomoserine (thiol)-lyase